MPSTSNATPHCRSPLSIATPKLDVARTTRAAMEGNTDRIMSPGDYSNLITFRWALHPHTRFSSTPRLLHNSIAHISSDLHTKQTSSSLHHGQEQKQEQDQICTGERQHSFSQFEHPCQTGCVLLSLEPDHILKRRQRRICPRSPNIRWYIGVAYTTQWSTRPAAQVTDRRQAT